MANEIELKLAFPPQARAAVLAHPLLTDAQRIGSSKALINTYFDTPDMALSARRVALRTRKSGQDWLQTVKCAAESFGGLSSRPEWEQAFDGTFDFSAIDAEAPRKLLEKHQQRIVPLFTTNFQRETLLLTPSTGTRILVMIDSGEVCVPGHSEPISELELELESGTADDLLALACELAASLPLLAYDASKAARGYALFRQESVAPQHPANTPIEPSTDPLTAFRQAAFQALACWTANQHAAIHSDNPEFTHQLRLALQQLRSLIRVFTPVLPADFAHHWQDALRKEAASLSEARDLDVLCDETLVAASEGDSDARLPALLTHAHQVREHAHAALRAQLSRPGAGMSLLSLSRALHALPPVSGPDLRTLAKRAIKTLERDARKKLKVAFKARKTPALHALRIAVKRLRHAHEIFALLSPEQAHTHTRQLTRVQTQLGQLHDLALAMPRLDEWANAEPALHEAVAFVAGWHAATSLKLRRRILPRCEKLLAHP